MSVIAEATRKFDHAARGASILDALAERVGQHLAPQTPEAALEPLPLLAAIRRAEVLLKPELDAGSDGYPTDALGPLAQAACDLAYGAQVSPAMAGQSFLAAAALLAQSRANVRTIDGGVRPLSLYCLTVARSGDGKDMADRVALRAIHEFQREVGQAWLREVEVYEETCSERSKNAPKPASPPPAPYRLAGDITIEGLHRSYAEGVAGQGVFSTEAGVMLAGHAMSQDHRTKTAASLCGLWDRGHLSVVRGGGGRFERYGVRLSAHLLAQPEALGDTLSDESLSGIGFWPRFLLAWPEELAPRVFRPWLPDESPAIVGFLARCTELLRDPMPDHCDDLPVIELSADARQELAAFFELMEHEARRGELRPVRPFALRATEQACRIAGVMAAWANKPMIDCEAAQNAIRLVRYTLQSWLTALGGKADPTPDWALTLYRWLAPRGEPMPIRDIPRIGPAILRSASRRDAALDRLLAAGLVAVGTGAVRALGVDQAKTQTARANAANPAKTRMDTGFVGHANGCETLRTTTPAACEFAGFRKPSQLGQSQAQQGFSQDSQHSQHSQRGSPQTVKLAPHDDKVAL